MGRANSWRRVGRMLRGTALKRWYKKFVRRRNRRRAKVDPTCRDKPLDSWAID